MGLSKRAGGASPFTDVAFLTAAVVILLAIYFQTILSFYDAFSSEGAGQTQAPLLLLVSLYLIYRTWDASGRRIELKFNLPALVLLCLFSLVWLAAGLVFVEAGQQAALILILAMLPVGLLGLQAGRRYLIPILLLLTIVPVWPVLIPYLQIMSAAASSYFLDLVGITSTREGFLLIIPNGTFEVADACSGLKFQIVGITLALIHTQLTKVPVRITVLYILMASLLAFFTNVLRICIVVTIGYWYGMQHEYVQDHNFIGWSLFAIAFFLFLFFGERQLIKYQVRESLQTEHQPSPPLMRRALGVVLTIVAFSLGPVMFTYYNTANSAQRVDLVNPSGTLTGWSRFSDNLAEWKPLWTQGDLLFEGRFRSGGDEVDLYATQFQRQSQGHEAVNVSHRVYDIDHWSRISRSARVVQLGSGKSLRVEVTLLQGPGHKQRQVWQWYRTNKKNIPNNAEAKLNNLLGVLNGTPDIAVYIVSKEVTKNEENASQVLADFVNAYFSAIDDRS